ncbi:primary amine oxidase [Quercus suber]|uniref:Amine oxidase n=1 Tax=Quercus suber TaxID=58331 RepID=A0AAW0KF60_QUESU
MRTDGSTTRKSYWTMIRELVKTELDARIWIDKPIELLIVNPNRFTKIGNQVGYRLVLGSATYYSTSTRMITCKCVAHFRITMSDRWANGLYVDQSHGDDTLFTWTNRNRDIEDRDIVDADFELNGGFELRPSNFFESNPILNTRPLKPVDLPTCNATTP